MNWLHGISKIVHNDLKSANLLLDFNLRVKVTDFGFSLIREDDKFHDKSKKGTPLWMSPEVMMGQDYDEKTDTYSFGIILWELFTRDVPYAHHNNFDTFYKAVCIDGERPVVPDDCPSSLRHLMTSCWDHNPVVRPSFGEIVFRVDEVIVDSVVEEESGRAFWKTHFLLPKQELIEEIPWRDFEKGIRDALGETFPEDRLPNLDALRPIIAQAPTATSLQGLQEDVVTMEKFDKVSKWFGPFYTMGPGADILVLLTQVSAMPWFHGDISKETAVARLNNREEGTFLIRLSSTEPKSHPYSLSMINGQHRRIRAIIEEDEAGGKLGVHRGYKLQGGTVIYPTLIDLVQKCVEHQLKVACPKFELNQGGYNPYLAVV